GRAKARGARLIVIDPRRTGLAEKSDVWLRVRPGTDGALALAMIHVLLDERLFDAAFALDWTNGAFLVRDDTGQLLTPRDLAPGGTPDAFLAWDGKRERLVGYHADRGYEHEGVEAVLSGAVPVTLSDGSVVTCRPAFAQLQELAARYAPERS